MQGRYPIWFAWPVHAMHALVWLELPMLLPVLFAQNLLGHFWSGWLCLVWHKADGCCLLQRLSFSESVLHISVRTLSESFGTREISDPCTILRGPEAPAISPVTLYI